ncbi:MAG: eukaryotic-like serine/threonine-protein kinase [Cryptosporangiaceae bacterium]|nr:eukaryotic-like serine/threonine-protein kinase [Cryptosporangiaceae bacterium]
MVSREPLHAGDPREISRYRIVARLGEGGMGVVYLGETPEGQLVAVKVIREHLATREDFRARFRAEVATASKVARFCTAPILDADTTADAPYIVSEFIDGPTLTDVVERTGPLPGAQLHALGVGVASALGAIHRAGVMHRDLKPSNVLLSQFGPQVIDFGIARAVDSLTSITQPGRMMGSPSYMAPERFRGGTVTQKVDIFAWGAIMAYAGTGHQPFGESTDAAFYQVLYGEPDLEGLDPQIAELVVWAVRKEPEERPTAQQLLDALVGGEPVSPAWPPSPPSGSTGERVLAGARHSRRVSDGGRVSASHALAPPQPGGSPAPGTSPSRRGGSRHRSTPARRHAPARVRATRPKISPAWIVLAVLGLLTGGGGSLGVLTYFDYSDARTGSTAAVSAYLRDIHNEDYSAAYGRLCRDITKSAPLEDFQKSLQASAGIETFTVASAVPFRLSAPYAVTARITEKNGNGHTSVFDVQKQTLDGRNRYLVCHVR